jgi:flavodoxin
MEKTPRVLIVYYTHTQQAKRVADVVTEVLQARGCDVSQASIEFTDPRFTEKFSRFPFKHAVFDLEAAKDGDYDLVCLGSPTWFFTANMPLRSYLKSDEAKKVLAGKPFAAYVVCRRYWSVNMREVKKLANKQGGKFVDSIKFQYEGGQIRSLLALLSYFGKGEMRERSLGIKIPPTNLKPDFGDQARAFANKLADSLDAPQTATGGTST